MHGTSTPAPSSAPAPTSPNAPAQKARSQVVTVTELRLSAFRAVRDLTVPLAPVTLLTGRSGSGKSTVLGAYEALAGLGGGDALGQVFGQGDGGALACVPRAARPDREGRRGFRLGCTVDGPAGPVRLDLAVQAEPELRVAGERLSVPDGGVLLSTALSEPSRRLVRAEWRTAAGGRVARAGLPDDRLATALLPLRAAGTTEEERRVLAAAEQVVVGLRSVFACDPRPETMRDPVPAGDGLLRRECDNLAAVLGRTRTECAIRHGLLVEAVRAGCAAPVGEVTTEPVGTGGGRELVRAVLTEDRGARKGPGEGRTPLGWLGDGELRYAALALVLLTGPGVLSMDPAQEVLPARQTLTVLADGLDRGLDRRQFAGLLELAVRMGERGHVRLLGTVGEGAGGVAGDAVGDVGGGAGGAAGAVGRLEGVGLVDLGGERIPRQSRQSRRP